MVNKKELFMAIFVPIVGTIVLCTVFMYLFYTKQDKPMDIYSEKIILKDEKANYGVLCLKEEDTIYYVINDVNNYKIYSYNETDGITLLETSKYKIYGLTFDENKLYYAYHNGEKSVRYEEEFKAIGENESYWGQLASDKSLGFLNKGVMFTGRYSAYVDYYMPFVSNYERKDEYIQIKKDEFKLSYYLKEDCIVFFDEKMFDDSFYEHQNTAIFKDSTIPYLTSVNTNSPLIFLYQYGGMYYIQKESKIYKFDLNNHVEEVCDIFEYGKFVTRFEIIDGEKYLLIRDAEIDTSKSLRGQYNRGINGAGGIWVKITDVGFEEVLKMPQSEEIVGKYQNTFVTYNFSDEIIFYTMSSSGIAEKSKIEIKGLPTNITFDQAGEFLFIYQYGKNGKESDILKYVINIETQEDVTEDFKLIDE